MTSYVGNTYKGTTSRLLPFLLGTFTLTFPTTVKIKCLRSSLIQMTITWQLYQSRMNLAQCTRARAPLSASPCLCLCYPLCVAVAVATAVPVSSTPFSRCISLSLPLSLSLALSNHFAVIPIQDESCPLYVSLEQKRTDMYC